MIPKACLQSSIFKAFLQAPSTGAKLAILQRKFHSQGATTEKALSLVITNLALAIGGTYKRLSPDNLKGQAEKCVKLDDPSDNLVPDYIRLYSTYNQHFELEMEHN